MTRATRKTALIPFLGDTKLHAVHRCSGEALVTFAAFLHFCLQCSCLPAGLVRWSSLTCFLSFAFLVCLPVAFICSIFLRLLIVVSSHSEDAGYNVFSILSGLTYLPCRRRGPFMKRGGFINSIIVRGVRPGVDILHALICLRGIDGAHVPLTWRCPTNASCGTSR